MAGLPDMQGRMSALDSVLGGGAPAGDTPETESPEMPQGPSPQEDFETGLALIEGAVGSASPELAEEARGHLNALRDVMSRIEGGAAGGPAPEEKAPAPEGEEINPEEMRA